MKRPVDMPLTGSGMGSGSGSGSDWPTMQVARGRGLRAIIAVAGAAARLSGMLAAKTLVPDLGVPARSKALSGRDSLLSIVQIMKGIPATTFAIGEVGAANAGLFAIPLRVVTDDKSVKNPAEFRRTQTAKVLAMKLESPK